MTLGDAQHEVFLGKDFSNNADYSPEIAFEIDKEVRRLVDDAFATAQTILEERRGQLDLMADVLIERETVARGELKALLDDRWEEFLATEVSEESDGGDQSEGIEVPESAPETKRGKDVGKAGGELGVSPSG